MPRKRLEIEPRRRDGAKIDAKSSGFEELRFEMGFNMPLAAGWVYNVFLVLFITLFIIVSIFLILIVLIQKGRGGGLASAFGGGGGNTAFGSKTGDVLTWATSIIFGIFLILAVVTNVTADHINAQYKKKLGEQEQQQTPPQENRPTTN